MSFTAGKAVDHCTFYLPFRFARSFFMKSFAALEPFFSTPTDFLVIRRDFEPALADRVVRREAERFFRFLDPEEDAFRRDPVELERMFFAHTFCAAGVC